MTDCDRGRDKVCDRAAGRVTDWLGEGTVLVGHGGTDRVRTLVDMAARAGARVTWKQGGDWSLGLDVMGW